MPSLARYIGHTQQHEEELKQSLTEADLAELREELSQLGEHGWLKWFAANRNEIADFLLSTPTARTRRKAWKNQSLRLRLTFGAIRYVQESGIVLSVLHESACIESSSMAGYRHINAEAAGLFYEMSELMDEVDIWPFHDGIDPPF